jgi:XRE family transcriptional regulator of biofilm formation
MDMLGKKIKQLRQQKGMSLTELALRADVSKSYLSTIERDVQKNPSIHFLEKIADVLGVSVFQLIEADKESVDALDQGWIELIKDAMEAGVDKQAFREFIEFQKWRNRKA